MPTTYNLPSQPTPFIGREPEIGELVALLGKPDCRLATLVGPGGTGKTRLAVEVAARLSGAYPHGIAYVALAPLQSSAEIAPAIVNALGIHQGDARTPRAALLAFLRQRQMLLVLDNFDHLLDGVDVVTDILAEAPGVRVLATSREVLNVQEEWVVPVGGLRVPEGDAVAAPAEYGAVQLFVERAGRVQHDFSLERDMACAVEICRLVDGMPLAIELAASWLKTLACAEVVAEIRRGLDILATNVRNIAERHRSIRTVFDHSWGMCTPEEQAVFRKLCVFRGGCERWAAEQVAGASLLTLTALVEKSMLWKLPSGRYRLHELLRQYAEEKLDAAGERPATEAAHSRAYAAFLKERTQAIKGDRQLAGLNEIEADFGNVRTAWRHAVTHADAATLDTMMEGLALFCDMRARYQVGEALLRQALDALAPADDADPPPVWNRLRARWIQVWILQERTPLPEAIAAQLQRSLDDAIAQDDRATAALCRWTAGELNRFEEAHDHGIPAYEQALLDYQLLGDTYYVVRVLRGIVRSYFVAASSDHWPRMMALNEQHLDLARGIGDRTGMAHAIYYDGIIALYITGVQQDHGERLLHEALAIWREMGDRKSVGVALAMLGMLAWMKGDREPAAALLIEARTLAEDVNFMNAYGMAISNQGFLALLAGDFEEGRRLCEASLAYHHSPSTAAILHLAQIGLALVAVAEGAWSTARATLRDLLDDTRFPLGMVLLLPVAAMVLAQQEDRMQAVRMLGRAFTHPVSITGWMERWPRLENLRSTLQAQLGPEAYTLAWEQGTQLTFDAVRATLRAALRDDAPVSRPAAANEQPLPEPLSERELEILALLAEGLSNREIAERLVLAVGTVKVHTRNIYGKLGVGNRTEAAAVARRMKLLPST